MKPKAVNPQEALTQEQAILHAQQEQAVLHAPAPVLVWQDRNALVTVVHLAGCHGLARRRPGDDADRALGVAVAIVKATSGTIRFTPEETRARTEAGKTAFVAVSIPLGDFAVLLRAHEGYAIERAMLQRRREDYAVALVRSVAVRAAQTVFTEVGARTLLIGPEAPKPQRFPTEAVIAEKHARLILDLINRHFFASRLEAEFEKDRQS